MRADEALVARGLASSRTRARALIEAGRVAAGGRIVPKPAWTVPPDTSLDVLGDEPDWASRGALKLLHALDAFAITVEGRTALDLGASTGGFTDALLRRGAARVIAVDVGHGQILPRLAADPRVAVFEGLDARAVEMAHVGSPVDLLVADLSFISLIKAYGPGLALVRPGGSALCLVKPQFEAGRAAVGRGGIVRDPDARDQALAAVIADIGARPGWRVLGTTESPVTGGDGNVEYLIHARRQA